MRPIYQAIPLPSYGQFIVAIVGQRGTVMPFNKPAMSGRPGTYRDRYGDIIDATMFSTAADAEALAAQLNK